jgi:hypothetical protein
MFTCTGCHITNGLTGLAAGSTTGSTAQRSSAWSSTACAPPGAIAIAVPLYYLAKPGQPTPFDRFPYAGLIVVAVATVYAFVLNGRDSNLADRVGSLVADE